MNDFYRIYKIIKENKGNKFALATIVRVDGSAYRREGAKMLFGEDGRRYGTISAGCLEEDLSYHVREVLETSQPKSVQYDLRTSDDLSWGQSAGCDGNIEVYIEAIAWEADGRPGEMNVWPRIEELLEAGKDAVCIKCVGGKIERGVRFLYSGGKEILEANPADGISAVLDPYLAGFAAGGGRTKRYPVPELGSDFLFERYSPKEPLYVFGAGPDAEPLVRLASQVDFSVTVIDPRGGRCTEENFPTADFRVVEHPETYLASTNLPANSYVLVMTHNFNWDQRIVRKLLESPPYYLGVLGPRRRTERLLRDLPLPDIVRSPIGISIGAEGPEEISISVAAELIQARSQARNQAKNQAGKQERASSGVCMTLAESGAGL